MDQTHTFNGRRRVRKFFGKIPEVAEMPNLIEVQKASYDQFLMVDEPKGGRPDEGLQAVFKSVFPISDFSGTSMLEFVRYEFEPPKYDVDECMQRDMTYSAPLKVKLRLIVFDVNEETGSKSIKDVKEQDVYMGDMPLMTSNGTFVINGTERVIVSQMHRSPGVFFDHDRGRTHASGKLLFAARIIPYRGSWLDFEFDAKDIVFARIDRRRKLPVTTLLYALGMDQEGIMDAFYDTVDYKLQRAGRGQDAGWITRFFPERVRGTRPSYDLVNAETGEIITKAGDKVTLEFPLGSSYLRQHHSGPILCIAGGSGLAPIKSIVETALAHGMKQPIHVYFGARGARDLYLVEHFETLADRHNNLSFTAVLSDTQVAPHRHGFVTDAVAEDLADFDGWKAYVAGPPPMVDAAMAMAFARGLRPEDMHADVFFTPEGQEG